MIESIDTTKRRNLRYLNDSNNNYMTVNDNESNRQLQPSKFVLDFFEFLEKLFKELYYKPLSNVLEVCCGN